MYEGEKSVYKINTSLPVAEDSLTGVTMTDASGANVETEKSAAGDTITVTVPTEMTDERYTLTLSGVKTQTNDVLRDISFNVWRPETQIRDTFENSVGKWEKLTTVSDCETTAFVSENGVAKATVTASTTAGDSRGNVPGVIRMINSGVGIDLEKGMDFVINTRLKKNTEDSRLYLRINYPYRHNRSG